MKNQIPLTMEMNARCFCFSTYRFSFTDMDTSIAYLALLAWKIFISIVVTSTTKPVIAYDRNYFAIFICATADPTSSIWG